MRETRLGRKQQSWKLGFADIFAWGKNASPGVKKADSNQQNSAVYDLMRLEEVYAFVSIYYVLPIIFIRNS
ncbi:hypothetical protein A2U01_0026973 [Trifolium medium]|uniref:Uncharacterized protein n=1 Tax=Trifolium medium TaxID=97028 RepID=A0A392P1P7_9FABA|nr:hypothetical protein [Trifolium medium]